MRYLKENPDAIEYNDVDVNFTNSDAYSIGLDKQGNMYIGEAGGTHGNTYKNYDDDDEVNLDDVPVSRNQFKYPGRIWKDEKIISFWEYPKRTKFFPLLPKMEKEWKRKFPNKEPLDFKKHQWYVERWTWIKIDDADSLHDFRWDHETIDLIPLKNYFQIKPEDFKIEFRNYDEERNKGVPKKLSKSDEKHTSGPPESVKTHTKRMTEGERFRSIIRDIVRDVLK